jgi:hypothetical protein
MIVLHIPHLAASTFSGTSQTEPTDTGSTDTQMTQESRNILGSQPPQKDSNVWGPPYPVQQDTQCVTHSSTIEAVEGPAQDHHPTMDQNVHSCRNWTFLPKKNKEGNKN